MDSTAKSSKGGRGEDDPLIPCHRLDPEAMPPEDCFDAYFDATADMQAVKVLDPQARQEGLRSTTWLLDNLVVVEADIPAVVTDTTPQHLRRFDNDLVSLSIGSGPACYLIMDDDCFATGDLHLSDFTRPQREGDPRRRAVLHGLPSL